MTPRSIKRLSYRYEVRRTRITLREPAQTYLESTIAGPDDAERIFRSVVGDAPVEHMMVFYLSTANRVMGYETVGIGGAGSVSVEAAVVFRGALLAGAARIILAHNHPSGDTQPSDADRRVTRAIKAAGELLGVPMIDHLICGERGCYSFAGKGEA